MIFKSAFILGSTSEIAENICIELALRGCKKFHLVSRNIEKNKNLIKKLNDLEVYNITTEEIELNMSFKNASITEYYDLYLIAIGYLGNTKKAKIDLKEAKDIFEINFLNLLPWISEITNTERIKKRGSLWIISSVAGDIGRPSNYFYGASKSALTIFCQGLANYCYKYPFKVRVIKAGFIDTKMTKGKAPKILCANPSKIAKSLLNNPNKRGVEYIPKWWLFLMFIVKRLPNKIISKL